MNKRGFLGLGVLGFFLMLFLLFYFLNSLGFIEVTGFVIGEGSSLTIDKILLTKINLVNDNVVTVNESFHIYDNIGCAVQYELAGDVNLSFYIYSPQNNVENPNKFYADVFNDEINETKCDAGVCLAYYNVTEFISGNWSCAAAWDDKINVSNGLAMENSAPILLKNIVDVNLNVNGSYINQSKIDLDDYFYDLEDDDLEYGAVGQLYLTVDIDDDGEVRFLNLENYEGVETIKFRAHDGLKGTFSNDVKVKVGGGVTLTPTICNSVWDCNWGECVNGKQRCAYFDRNNCGATAGKPNDLERNCAGSLGTTKEQKKPLVLTGSLDIEKPTITGMKRTLMIIGIIVIVLALVGFGVYLLYRKPVSEKQPYVQETIQQNQTAQSTQTTNLPELQNYIESALQEGQGRQKIEMDLLKVGWQKSDIENSYNFVVLKKFVKDKLSSGVSKEEIVKGLKAKGWKDDLINAVVGALEK